jgi:hypothetical protein
MIETHPIRLRGPWECGINNGEPRRVQMPAALAEVISTHGEGHLICRRRFGCPTCLDPHERVWLVIEGSLLSGEAQLNGEPLGRLRSGRDSMAIDITTRLCERNEIALDFDVSAFQSLPTAADLLFADVRLEIRG